MMVQVKRQFIGFLQISDKSSGVRKYTVFTQILLLISTSVSPFYATLYLTVSSCQIKIWHKNIDNLLNSVIKNETRSSVWQLVVTFWRCSLKTYETFLL